MEIALLLLKQVVLMFVLMCIGYVFYKLKLISDKGSSDFGKLLLYLVIPVVVINNLWTQRTPEKVTELIHSSLLGLVCIVIAVAVSYFVFRKKSGVAMFSSSFSNVGFIGIPLISAAVGSDAVFYISALIVLVNALQWTAGVVMLTGDTGVMKPEKVVRNPIIVSVAIGLVLFVLNIPKPVFVQNVFSTITGLNTPLAMIVSGVYLAHSDLVKMFMHKDIYVLSGVRLVLIPLISLLLLWILPIGSQMMKTAILIGAACPVGSNVAIFAQQYGKNYTEAVEQVCVTTILCLVTLPLVVMIAGALL